MSVRDFARGILRSRDYRRSIIHRVTLGNLPPAVEVLLYHYAEGKPVDKIEVTTPEMEQLTSEQLEARAMQLAVLARDLRAREEAPAEPASEPSPAGVAVH